jgi:large subunit ribosomal protein L31
MKSGLHPDYTHQAKVSCGTCGTTFETGSTTTELRVEVCSHCHPFYTGKQNLVDTAGRVDRFRKLVAKSKTSAKTVVSRRVKLQTKRAKRLTRAPKAEE